jgi:hypothetical protein
MELILLGVGFLALFYWRPVLTIILIGAGLAWAYHAWPTREDRLHETQRMFSTYGTGAEAPLPRVRCTAPGVVCDGVE